MSFQFVCKYCHKVYVREKAFLLHECKQQKREKELQTVIGQLAWSYYQSWVYQKKRSSAHAQADLFMSSSFYDTFIRFAKFVKKINLPLPDKFIWLMIKRDFPPTMWMMDEVYSQYIEFLDSDISPMQLVNSSVKVLLDYADSNNIDTSDIFAVLDPNELIHWIRIRKMSPWLLLFSPKFVQFFSDMTIEQQAIIEKLIHPDKWADKKQRHKEDIEKIKKYVQELEI